MSGVDKNLSDALSKEGLRPVMPEESSSDVEEVGVTLRGVDANDEQLIKLLEDTVKFIRSAGGRPGAEPMTEKRMAFQRLEVGDTVVLKHRS